MKHNCEKLKIYNSQIKGKIEICVHPEDEESKLKMSIKARKTKNLSSL